MVLKGFLEAVDVLLVAGFDELELFLLRLLMVLRLLRVGVYFECLVVVILALEVGLIILNQIALLALPQLIGCLLFLVLWRIQSQAHSVRFIIQDGSWLLDRQCWRSPTLIKLSCEGLLFL